MAAKSTIEWTDASWSPLRARVRPDAADIARSKGYSSLIQIAEKMAGHVGHHCEHASHGCEHCYSETNNGRCLPSNGTGLPFDRRARDLIDPFVDEKILLQPLKWRQPRRVFVESQSDLFGAWNTDDMIDRVFAVMALCPQHKFQCLTKRPDRMRVYLNGAQYGRMCDIAKTIRGGSHSHDCRYPLSNLWLGISCEDQPTADERIPALLKTPAAIRFVSYEPALEVVDFRLDGYCLDTGAERRMDLHWIIVGGESGPGARPFDVSWARNVVEQCKYSGTACFVKQLGAKPMMNENQWRGRIDGTGKARLLNPLNARYMPSGFVPLAMSDGKGGNMDDWDTDLRVRQFPGEVAVHAL